MEREMKGGTVNNRKRFYYLFTERDKLVCLI